MANHFWQENIVIINMVKSSINWQFSIVMLNYQEGNVSIFCLSYRIRMWKRVSISFYCTACCMHCICLIVVLSKIDVVLSETSSDSLSRQMMTSHLPAFPACPPYPQSVQAYQNLDILHTIGQVWGKLSSAFWEARFARGVWVSEAGSLGPTHCVCSVDDNDTMR